jgi:hypothetical protein
VDSVVRSAGEQRRMEVPDRDLPKCRSTRKSLWPAKALYIAG